MALNINFDFKISMHKHVFKHVVKYVQSYQ